MILEDVPLRSIRVLSRYKVYDVNALLVLNGISLNSIKCLSGSQPTIYMFFSFSFGKMYLCYKTSKLLCRNPHVLMCFIARPVWQNEKMVIKRNKSSVESQKGVIVVQRGSIENQKGAIAVQSLWR